jgi:hypothetical protein
LIEIEGDSCSDADGREEGVGAGPDASPILEPCEHILDFVAVLIECLVKGQRGFSGN